MSGGLNSVFLTIFSLYFVKCTLAVEFVPVYMWETKKNLEPIPALDRIGEESFKDLLLERLSKNPFVVVFAENNLSPEDFAQRNQNGKPVFTHISKLKSEGKVTYWPFVRNPFYAVKQLDKKITEVNGESYVRDMYEVPSDNILIVDLQDAKDDEDRSEMLKRHDVNIASIYDKLLQQHENVVALYTARHSSWIIPEDVRSHRRSRSLLADNDTTVDVDNRKIFNETDILFYLNSTSVYTNNTVTAVLNNLEFVSDVQAENVTLTISNSNISFEFGFVMQSGYWFLNYVNVSESGKIYGLKTKEIYAPNGFSYHCNSQVLYGDQPTQNLTLPGFQIQIANGTIERFGDAYDCVGFTTAPIWSGLFVTFILALIMSLGLSMMMDIKTMDRFDDPKGKTITVNVSE